MSDHLLGADGDVAGAGTLYGIGLGPGDPELITVKGLRLLRAAEVVFLPTRRAGAPSYAGHIAAEYLDPARQAVVPLVYPAGWADRATECWNANADEIAARLRGGRPGVFLTEGDPLLYSTFVHALVPLRERHPEVAVRVVPGVWSGSAAAARLAEPLADGDERLAVLPATYGLDELPAVLRCFDTAVLLKPGDDPRALRAAVAAAGATAVWVERVGRPEERVVHDLATLPDDRPDYFSLVILRSGRRVRDARHSER
ncbi:MAG TPA: precorrin-2 C(20)-methyltransferase [Chloroflexota bacterium]|nr:precorrin-2 C(20)-methyltransferase [Chloroflexota bacterium]